MNTSTRFDVAARLERSPVSCTSPSLVSPAASDQAQRNAPLRILVIDDEPAVIEVVRFCLSDEGYVIESATDGISGLDRFRDGNWDAVIMDRCMPRMNGCELAVAIRAIAPDVPIVMLTGLPEALEHESECMCAIDSVLRKPFTLEQVRNAVVCALQKHRRS